MNGVVERRCDPCVAKLRSQLEQAAAEYEALPIRTGRAFLAAGTLSIACALVSMAVAVVTDHQFWLLGAAAGAVIAVGTLRATSRTSPAIQGIIAAASALSPVLGLLFLFAYFADGAGWLDLILGAPLFVVEMGDHSMFAAGAGLVGAVVAGRVTAKPRFEIELVR